jgi:lipopolysaccharide export system permease protein
MNTYIKFLTYTFYKSLFFVFFVMGSLVYILNLLSELDFFKDINIEIYFPLFLSLLNSPAMLFEMLPFIFLITTQLFFIKLFNNNEIEVFKYSGLKNTKIILILSVLSILTGLIASTLFYNFSSNFKNIYLKLKSQYTDDGKYLAVITKNGLWIKDIANKKILIINSSKIDNNYLINNFITEFNEDYTVLRNIKSSKIDITDNEWKIFNAKIFKKNNYEIQELLKLKTNFNQDRIQSLYSNLSSLNIFQLYELRENYKKLNYSVTEVELQLLKLASYPLYLFLITVFASLMMLKIKRLENTTFKIALGLFFSVIIYYINNFFMVMGNTERMSIIFAILIPLILLTIVNSLMLNKINDK